MRTTWRLKFMYPHCVAWKTLRHGLFHTQGSGEGERCVFGVVALICARPLDLAFDVSWGQSSILRCLCSYTCEGVHVCVRVRFCLWVFECMCVCECM